MTDNIKVTEETISYIMERNGVPECLRDIFKGFVDIEVNNTTMLDMVFYRYKKHLSDFAEAMGESIVKQSYIVSETEE